MRRRAALTVMDALFHRLTTWLAPILVFTMEEVWLNRFPGPDSSVHLVDFPVTPADWRDDALAAKWSKIRAARRVVNGALEIVRRDKVIGASLEAAPVLYIDDPEIAAAVKSVEMADLCITSGLILAEHEPPTEAFRLDNPIIGVVFEPAPGAKCQRCWKILEDVGRHGRPGVCGRCESVLGGAAGLRPLAMRLSVALDRCPSFARLTGHNGAQWRARATRPGADPMAGPTR